MKPPKSLIDTLKSASELLTKSNLKQHQSSREKWDIGKVPTNSKILVHHLGRAAPDSASAQKGWRAKGRRECPRNFHVRGWIPGKSTRPLPEAPRGCKREEWRPQRCDVDWKVIVGEVLRMTTVGIYNSS
jgi:hypothetical protein